jgi:hypothetical protein
VPGGPLVLERTNRSGTRLRAGRVAGALLIALDLWETGDVALLVEDGSGADVLG